MHYEKMSLSVPYELVAWLINFLNKKEWPNIVFANKEVLELCTPDLKIGRATCILKPYVQRLHACYLARQMFVARLHQDIPFRLKYLFVHEPETGPTHICWRKVPPRCLAIDTGLENCQRLLSGHIAQMDMLLQGIDAERYQWILNNVRIVEGRIKIGI